MSDAKHLGGQPINPMTPDQERSCQVDVGWGSLGLTKRELFAAMAMQGLLSSLPHGYDGRADKKVIASMATKCADLLLAELTKDPT